MLTLKIISFTEKKDTGWYLIHGWIRYNTVHKFSLFNSRYYSGVVNAELMEPEAYMIWGPEYLFKKIPLRWVGPVFQQVFPWVSSTAESSSLFRRENHSPWARRPFSWSWKMNRNHPGADSRYVACEWLPEASPESSTHILPLLKSQFFSMSPLKI